MANSVIPPSELILIDGKVYHLNLRPEMVADTIIVVGDPERVPKISVHFDKIEHKVSSRELVTHTGYIGKKHLSVISSGMGTDNVELLMTELDALVNVDLDKRQVKEELTELEIIRIGTSGCLQEDIPLDAFLMSTAGLGLDTLMHFHEWEPDKIEAQVASQMQEALGLSFEPYFAPASDKLLERFKGEMLEGVTITAPGFYAPQGRSVRLKAKLTTMLDTLAASSTPYGRFTNFEMETAAYYALAKMLGHQMLSINALIANRARQEFSSDHDKAVEDLIQLVLEKISV